MGSSSFRLFHSDLDVGCNENEIIATCRQNLKNIKKEIEDILNDNPINKGHKENHFVQSHKGTLNIKLENDKRDWKEDFKYENGYYLNTCCRCGHTFIGHKRRVVCKSCANKINETVSADLDQKRVENSNHNGKEEK